MLKASSLDGLRLPDRMSGPEQSLSAPTPHTVVVHPGDTLWAIAADSLPTGAAPAAVDRAWRSLYAANQAVIGPDPDLIHAGTELRLPPVLQPVTEEENR